MDLVHGEAGALVVGDDLGLLDIISETAEARAADDEHLGAVPVTRACGSRVSKQACGLLGIAVNRGEMSQLRCGHDPSLALRPEETSVR